LIFSPFAGVFTQLIYTRQMGRILLRHRSLKKPDNIAERIPTIHNVSAIEDSF
jgi:hypothetical protein